MNLQFLRTGTVALVAVGIAACTPPSVQDTLPQQFGNATPVASPPARDSVNDVVALSGDMAEITQLSHIGNLLAVKYPYAVALGELSAFDNGTPTIVEIDRSCGDMTTTVSARQFIFGCADGVYAIDVADGADAAKFTLIQPTDHPVTTAVKTSQGAILAGHNDSATVELFRDGHAESIRVEDTTDNMIAVPNDSHGSDDGAETPDDSVYRINRQFTIIQNIDVDTRRPGAVLRVGMGVGQLVAGEKGMALTSDAIGRQFGVYQAKDVIRLHQTTPTAGQAPWALAWDSPHQLVWVATTSDNMLRGYSISEGVGNLRHEVDTIANVHSLTILDDDTIIAGSATGDGLQVIHPSTLN